MIDTHIHLDEEAYAEDREEVIARQLESGVEMMIVPGVNAASIPGILDVCRKHKGACFAALGFHPQDVAEDWKEQWAIIEKAIRENRAELVAIGEIGLDYHYELTYKKEQQEVFERQLDLALELELPVMIHNRDATEDTMKILTRYHSQYGSALRGVVHCFSGSRETAEQVVKMGFYLGIGGVLTFKNSKLREHLVGIPLDRIVLETDGPYLAPTPHRGERNESRWMKYVAEYLAELYHCSADEVIAITSRNARNLFRLQ